MICILWHNFFPKYTGFTGKFKGRMAICPARGSIKITPLRSVFKNTCGIIDVTKNPFYILQDVFKSHLMYYDNIDIIEDLAYHILWFENKSDIVRLTLDKNIFEASEIPNNKYIGSFECKNLDIFKKPTENLINNIKKSIEVVKPYNSVSYHLRHSLNKIEEDDLIIPNKKKHIKNINYTYNSLEQIIDNEKLKREKFFIDYLNFLKQNISNWSSSISFGTKQDIISDIDNFFID